MTRAAATPRGASPPAGGQGPRDLGALLAEAGAISGDQVRIALTEQRTTGVGFADALVRLGFVTEAIIRDALGGALRIDSVDLGSAVAEADATAAVPERVARRFLVAGLALEHDAGGAPRRLTVAMADPFDVIALDHLGSLFDGEVEIVSLLAGRGDIERFIDRAYGHDLSVSGILGEIEGGEAEPAAGIARGGDEYSQPIVRLVDVLLSDAVKQGASDIHFEPEAGFLRVRYRIDGVLRQVRSLHRGYWSAIAVRLKVMSGVNIAETRAPQDGRMTLSVSGRDIDFRVSCLPTAHGENVVLRVLDRSRGLVPLDELGLSSGALAELRRMMERPEGLILVTGPTGSGKTTTLYSMLAHLDREEVNVMTLEDPVEYPMTRIRQTSVNESVKLGFANGVRSLLRQDPDIILVGEIRDADTAAMTFRAAMTGHQVYSTLHTSSAVGAIARLRDIGVAPGVLAGNIIGIVAQRLVRRLCPACRSPVASGASRGGGPRTGAAERMAAGTGEDREARADAEPEGQRPGVGSTGEAGASAESNPGAPPGTPPFRAVGCPRCGHQGYRGRLALTEVLRFDAEIDDLVARGAPARKLLEAAQRQGFVSLAEDAVRRVADGSSTFEEVARVVDLTHETSRSERLDRQGPSHRRDPDPPGFSRAEG